MEKAIQNNYSKVEMKARKEILEFLARALGKNYKEEYISIEYPPDPEMGDYTVSFFRVAKKSGMNPQEMARNMAELFETEIAVKKDGRIIAHAKSAGPYLNFINDTKRFADTLIQQILNEGEGFGKADIGKGKRVMIEYSQPNTHKEFHVGHLRNVSIGSAMVNVYRTLGYKVIAANYIGDVGAHVAKCLWAFLKFHSNEPLPENKGKYFGKLYIEGNTRCSEDENCKKESSEVLQKLEGGDKKLVALWKKTRKWCLEEFENIYKRLGIEFDIYFYESEVEKDGRKVVGDLLKKGIAKKSEGAVVIDLEPYNLRTFLLLKTDGTSLYSTKDLALAMLKFKKYKIDTSIILTDNRQSFYFQQLFKTLEVIGFKKDMVHIPYEFVTLKEGAMSSRSGNVVLFEDFEDMIIKKIYAETKKRHEDWKEKDIAKTAKEIAYGAMKYSMLTHANNTIVVFDMEKALELSGNTGPYLQYVHARISSILYKAKVKISKRISFSAVLTKEEKHLLQHVAKYPIYIQRAAEKFDPSAMALYLHELAHHFSIFYENVPILKAEGKLLLDRITLISAVKQVMASGLKILGIDAPEKM